jgi:hypothetical protein
VSEKTPKEPTRIEPVPKDEKFFVWLEKLFDGAGQYPEKIETRVVSGRHNERLGPMIKQIVFSPQARESVKESTKETKTGDKGRNSSKPTREELVAMSNELLYLCQRDCDQARRPLTYGVHVSHFMREVDFYERWIMFLKPQGVHAPKDGEEVEDEDGEGGSLQRKYSTQIQHHHERMFNLYGGALEGVIDRQDRALEREASTNERLRSANERLLEMVEKLQSQEHVRKMDLQWNDMKIRSVEKGLELAINLAPPLLSQLTGKKPAAMEETYESITLKMFFKRDDAGGKMTIEQADAAFGKHDNEGNILTPGVFSREQAGLLWDVAHCVARADELDRLLPGGSLEVKQEQVIALQQIFPMEQLAPIIALIGMRMQNRMQSQNNGANAQ